MTKIDKAVDKFLELSKQDKINWQLTGRDDFEVEIGDLHVSIWQSIRDGEPTVRFSISRLLERKRLVYDEYENPSHLSETTMGVAIQELNSDEVEPHTSDKLMKIYSTVKQIVTDRYLDRLLAGLDEL